MSDISKIIEDNSVRELQELEDQRIMDIIEDELGMFPPYWRWLDADGVVHMTGLTRAARRTRCGVRLDPVSSTYPTGDHLGFVTCLGCF